LGCSRSYSELQEFETFQERYEYLVLGGTVAHETFGVDRDLNQRFYKSWEWKQARDYVILRDNGCDLGVPGYDIFEAPLVHHINPMKPEHIAHGADWIVDPEYLITTTLATHNAIHYGSELTGPIGYVERRPGDTKLW